MGKYFRLFLLAVLAVGLMVGPAWAMGGKLDVSGAPVTVSKELVRGGVPLPGIANMIGSANYTAKLDTTLSEAGVFWKLSGAKWQDNSSHNLALCDLGPSDNTTTINNATLISSDYTLEDGGATIHFSIYAGGNATQVMKNDHVYVIGTANGTNCAPLSGSLRITDTQESVTLTVETYHATGLKDRASAKLLEAKQEFFAKVLNPCHNTSIDYKSDFKKFYVDCCQKRDTDKDYVAFSVWSEWKSFNDPSYTVVGGGYIDNDDKLIVTLHGNTQGIKDVTLDGIENSCVVQTNKIVCTAKRSDYPHTVTLPNCRQSTVEVGDKSINHYIIFTVTGQDVLKAPREFTMDAELEFANANLSDKADRTIANNWPLLQNQLASKWAYLGTSIYVPFVKTDPANGVETYIKLISKDNSGLGNVNSVKAIVPQPGNNANPVVVDLGNMTAAEPFLITGADIKTKVEAQGGTVAAGAAKGFGMILNVTTDAQDLFGYATIIDHGVWRRIPLLAGSGLELGGDNGDGWGLDLGD